MSTVSQNGVVEFCEQQEWDVVNVFDKPKLESPQWSVTAVTNSGVRVTIDEPMEDPRLNNIFVENTLTEVSSVDDYTMLVDEAPESITVDVESEDGLFMRAKHSPDVDLDEAGLVERLEEKGAAWNIRVISVGCTQESSFDDIRSWVNNVQALTENL